jgi:preprotein translocase subunit YajC
MTATILLQAGGGLGVQQLIMFGLIAVVFYFFMIRPQMKKQLKKGDKIITTAGIHGRIFEVADTTFLIEVEGGTKIRFDKSAVSLESSKALNTPVVTK